MFRVAFTAIALLLGWTAAQLATPAATYQAEPGAFISIPVTGQGSAALTVMAPPFITVVGSPALTDGFTLLNLLLGPAAPAGTHQVSISETGSGQAGLNVSVQVTTVSGVDLRVPAEETVVRGETVEYTLQVTNTGNAADVVQLEVKSALAASLSAAHFSLHAGETREVTLQLQADRVGRDLAIVTAELASSPEAKPVVRTIRTTVLAFAGAGAIDGPALNWQVRGSAAHGGSGLAYALQGQLAGELSNFIAATANLALTQRAGGSTQVSGGASLTGESWAAGYRGSSSSHRFDARYLDFRAFAGFGRERHSLGVSYDAEPFIISITHSGQNDSSRQRLTVGYRTQVLPELSLTPSLGVERIAGIGDARFGAVFTLSANLQLESMIGAARVYLPIPAGSDWTVAVVLASRQQTPVGVQGELQFGGRGLQVSAGVNTQLSEEVTLQSRIRYSGRTRLATGVRYRPRVSALTLGATLGTTFGRGDWTFDYQLSAAYAPQPFVVAGYFGGVSDGSVSFGVNFEYQLDGWSVAASYRHDSRRQLLGVEAKAGSGGFTGFAGYGYDFLSPGHQLDLGVEYGFAAGHNVFAAVGLAEETTWQIGAAFVLRGGFATPEGVIGIFGGRTVGTVSGTVFHDGNRNGLRDSAEPGIAGVIVTSGRQQTITDAAGNYQLLLSPGDHELSVHGVTASYGLLERLSVIVAADEAYQVDIPLQTVTTLIVSVFDDRDRNSMPDDGEAPLSLISVTAQAADGQTVQRLSDTRGEAVFQNLAPGRYSVALNPASLPRFFEATNETLTVELAAGPIKRITLGATEREKAVRQTFSMGDLSLVARIEPHSAPPGADVLVTAQVQGTADSVQAATGEHEVQLAQQPDGSFAGRLHIPEDTRGLLLITVRAENATHSREQQLPLVIGTGSLAKASVLPTLADPGEALVFEVSLLKKVSNAWVELAGERHQLKATGDPYVFRGNLTAPDEPGSHVVEFFAEDEKLTEARFRVQ